MPKTRAERHAEIVAARDAGEPRRETLARLGISNALYYDVLNDPTGDRVRERRERYRRPCPGCGILMSGSDGFGARAPKRCRECASKEAVAARVWTRQAIIEAIRAFAAKYGRPPGARDWNPALAIAQFRDDIAERYYEDGWPSATTVQDEFGRWSAAIRAAGFTPLRPGQKYVDQGHV